MFFTITRLVNLALNSFKRSNFSSLLQLKGKYIVEILHRHHVFALLKYLNESYSSCFWRERKQQETNPAYGRGHLECQYAYCTNVY